ncbi:MAG TPA: hypothetical protein VF458_04365 [Ktedonobacteraceae bacterium]
MASIGSTGGQTRGKLVSAPSHPPPISVAGSGTRILAGIAELISAKSSSEQINHSGD